MRAIREAPHLVSYSLATTLAPTDLETMDHDMVAVIAQQDEILSQRRQAVVNAWSGGHDAALRQLESFYARLAELGVVVQRFAKTAIATRLLGPGADPGLLMGLVSGSIFEADCSNPAYRRTLGFLRRCYRPRRTMTVSCNSRTMSSSNDDPGQ